MISSLIGLMIIATEIALLLIYVIKKNKEALVAFLIILVVCIVFVLLSRYT
ncbi:MAG: hypothetical protein Q7S66_05000 [bacterium]|nr:hypothetical protein [bacterium]